MFRPCITTTPASSESFPGTSSLRFPTSALNRVTCGWPSLFNLAPFGSAWQPYSQDPTTTAKFDGTTNLPVNMYRPYAGYTNAIDYTWGTNNNYNALQTSLNKRVGGALQLGIAYTWSKALGVSVGHINDTRTAGYGPLPQDRTQSLVVNYIYDIPGIHKGSFLDNAASRLVLNGWQLSGLTSISSGAPVNVTYGYRESPGQR